MNARAARKTLSRLYLEPRRYGTHASWGPFQAVVRPATEYRSFHALRSRRDSVERSVIRRYVVADISGRAIESKCGRSRWRDRRVPADIFNHVMIANMTRNRSIPDLRDRPIPVKRQAPVGHRGRLAVCDRDLTAESAPPVACDRERGRRKHDPRFHCFKSTPRSSACLLVDGFSLSEVVAQS